MCPAITLRPPVNRRPQRVRDADGRIHEGSAALAVHPPVQEPSCPERDKPGEGATRCQAGGDENHRHDEYLGTEAKEELFKTSVVRAGRGSRPAHPRHTRGP